MDVTIGLGVLVVVVVVGLLLFRRWAGGTASWDEMVRFGLINQGSLLTLELGSLPMLVINGKSAPIKAPPVNSELLEAVHAGLGSQTRLRIAVGGRVYGDISVRSKSPTKVELELYPP